MAIGMSTYLQGDKRESLASLLKDTSPLDGNWLMGNLGNSSALQPYHQWTVFSVSRPTSVTVKAEGFTSAASDHTAPSKSGNYTAIVSRHVQVTGSDESVEPAAGYNPMSFQKEVELRRLNSDMEFLIVNGSGPSAGASGVARGMAGIDNCISSNVTARSSGTSFSSIELEDILQESWDAVGKQFVADTLLVPMVIKRRISQLTTNITNYVKESDKLYSNISVYEASTGMVRVVPHKDIRDVAGTTTVYAIKPELYRVAYLRGREPKFEKLAKTGDFESGMYVTEFTLESLGEEASVKRTGYSRTLA